MKKMLTTLATLATLSTTALNADFVRVEMGGGMWNQTSKGYFQYEKKGVATFPGLGSSGTATATDTSQEVEKPNGYFWAYIKHPIPIVPNLRVEYSKIESEGILTVTGELYGMKADSAPVPTNLELTQTEVIPYYNLLDNTFWLTLDLGIDVKLIHYEASGGDGSTVDYDESGDIPLPLVYVRARVQPPLTNFGIEAVLKYISDGGDNTVSDMLIKADYTLDFIPIIQPGLEVGYRVMSMDSDITDGDTRTIIDYDFAGVYGGLMLRF